MAIGPVQLLVIGFDSPDFRGEVLEEFERLRDHDTVRVIDALVVYKDSEGEVAALELSQMDEATAMEFGAKVGALIGALASPVPPVIRIKANTPTTPPTIAPTTNVTRPNATNPHKPRRRVWYLE